MIDKLKDLLAKQISELYGLDISPEVNNTEERFGEYFTNVCLQLAPKLNKGATEIAEELVAKLSSNQLFSKVSLAPPGFINFRLTTKALFDLVLEPPQLINKSQNIIIEYSDPNPFKVLHAGHLYTSIIGEAIAKLLEVSGGQVHRLNFGGDIGLHVAKTMSAILDDLGGEYPDKLTKISKDKRAGWLSRCYVAGHQLYESGDQDQVTKIKELNKKIYELALNQDHSTPLAKIYWTTRSWSYQAFDDFYSLLNIKFERYYPESEVAALGLNTVRAHIPSVYSESQGAVIFDGSKYGLYANVFINAQKMPTYAAKDIGLLVKKWQDYHYDRSIIITANEQADYLRVVLKSASFFLKPAVSRTQHLTHGLVKLSGGKKMSSRSGNIIEATTILKLAEQAAKDKQLTTDKRVSMGAVKYAFLKQSIGADIIYDPKESVSLEGHSGPYLQYAYARSRSILKKAPDFNFKLTGLDLKASLTPAERSLLRKISQYGETVNLAATELKPHFIALYLYDLCQVFNRFYENSKVVGDQRQELRLSLVKLYSQKLAEGLKLLGLDVLEEM